MKHDTYLYRFLLIATAAGGLVAACDRHRTPPEPDTSAAQAVPAQTLPARAPASSAATDTNNKMPYGAAAPMAPGTDGVRPPTSTADALSGRTPERIMNNAPTGAGPDGAGSALSATELTFITQAMDAGLFNLRMGQLATDRANDSAVKSYAALLVTDQIALNSGLQQLAKQLGTTMPDSLSEPRQRALDQLARTSEQDFDRQFLALAGVSELQATIELFERTGRETRQPLVRSFVLATLPTLRGHLTVAERLPTKG